MKKAILVILGILSLALGVVGIFLPVLPTTPFLLLAAALFIRSSERLYRWLIKNRFLGARIKRFYEKGGMTRREKGYAIGFMWLMIAVSLWIIGFNGIIIALGAAGTAAMGFFVKTV